MNDWGVFFYILGLGFAGWLIMRSIKLKPEMFTADSFLQSSKVLAILALCLIGFIAFVASLL